MNNRRALVLSVLLVIALGIVVVATMRSFAPDAPTGEVEAREVAEPSVAPDPTTASTAVPSGDEAPPPWATGVGATAAMPASPAANAPDPLRDQQMQQLQQSMQGVIAGALQRSDATNAHLRQALTTLEQMNDPAVTAQINLPAVRHNLEISLQMQALAQTLQQELAQPVSPERRQRLDATMARFRQLQAQLRTDVRADGAAAPAPVPAPAAAAATGR
jgi:hypothetical protein